MGRPALRVAAVLTAMFALQLYAWTRLIEHNAVRASAALEAIPDQATRNLTALSSDLLEYRDYFRDFPTRVDELSLERTFVEYYKRPLYGPISAALNVVASQGLGLEFPQRLYVILALYATTATTAMAALAMLVGLSTIESVLLAALCAVSFGWATTFSIPESYSLSVCGTLLAAISGQCLPPLDEPRGKVAAFGHAIVSGLASWLYLPALGAVLLTTSRIVRVRQLFTLVVPACIAAGGVGILPHIFWGTESLQTQAAYGNRLASFAHALDVTALGQVAGAFVFSSVLSPVEDFVSAAAEAHPIGALAHPMTALGTMALLAIHVVLIGIAVRRRRLPVLCGALLWLAGLYVFHVLFNPREVLLYLSVPTAVLFYIAALVLAPEATGRPPLVARPDRPRLIAVLIAMVAFTLVHNVWSIVGTAPS